MPEPALKLDGPEVRALDRRGPPAARARGGRPAGVIGTRSRGLTFAFYSSTLVVCVASPGLTMAQPITSQRTYEFRCPVHGFIEVNDWERSVIDHSAFQRLRRIRQLGWTDQVYPGSTHTRFEHSLGVMHVVTRLVQRHLATVRGRPAVASRLRCQWRRCGQRPAVGSFRRASTRHRARAFFACIGRFVAESTDNEEEVRS